VLAEVKAGANGDEVRSRQTWLRRLLSELTT